MISETLYEEVLVEPAEDGADELLIVSGYASSAMAFHHLESLSEIRADVSIRLLVGMCSTEGLPISSHRGFQKIMGENPEHFSCSYIHSPPPVHSKLYIWRKRGKKTSAFVGSANYTQNAFLNDQREILAYIPDDDVVDYFDALERNSIFCNHQESESLVRIYNDRTYYGRRPRVEPTGNVDSVPKDTSVENVIVSLLARGGKIHNKGGLNWGQREGRNPNQAYLQLSPDVYRSDFFPLRGLHFTVVTDDSKIFVCTRAQKGAEGQAIETPHNNALLGEYFRSRLGVASGAFVRKEDLEAYGRTSVTFYKFDEENYYMDFSAIS